MLSWSDGNKERATYLCTKVLEVNGGAVCKPILAKLGAVLHCFARLLPLLGWQCQALACWIVLFRDCMILLLQLTNSVLCVGGQEGLIMNCSPEEWHKRRAAGVITSESIWMSLMGFPDREVRVTVITVMALCLCRCKQKQWSWLLATRLGRTQSCSL